MKQQPKQKRRSIVALPGAAASIASAWVTSTTADPPIITAPSQTDEQLKTSEHRNTSATCPDDEASGSFSPRCAICRDLVVPQFGFGIDVSLVLTSPRRRCRSCLLLFTILQPYTLSSKNGSSIYIDQEMLGTIKVRFEDYTNDAQDIELSVHTSEDGACPWSAIATQVPSRTCGTSNLDKAAATILDWLKGCTDGHGSCKSTLSPQLLPTRILRIDGSKQIRLHVSNQSERARYVCLSHCWGDLVTLSTTVSTYQQLQKGIPWDQCPRTFQHAIDLTLRLGLEYLWIDSLCIIQDDIEDWRNEGSNMASIYSHSYLTIAATSSPNAAHGLIEETLPSSHVRSYTFRTRMWKSYKIHVRQTLDHTSFFCNGLPLLKRAWVFQEGLLSPRVVHFADHELYWKCRGSEGCECGYLGMPGFWLGLDTTRFRWLAGNRALPPEDTCSSTSTSEPVVAHSGEQDREPDLLHEDLVNQWRTIVFHYSRLCLTFEGDIFPALQGIAKRMQAARKSRYLAGLWEDELPLDLLWYYRDPCLSQPTSYRAPTWSWASRSGHVLWSNNLGITRTSLISVSTTPAGTDPTGEIRAGSIKLRGPCLRVTDIDRDPLNKSDIYRKLEKMDGRGSPSLDGYFDYLLFRPDTPIDDGAKLIFMVIAGHDAATDEKSLMGHEEYGLLLEQVDKDDGVYRRVGFSGYYCSPSLIMSEALDMTLTII